MILKIKNIVFKSWFLSLIISVPIIILLPPIFNKYEVITIEKGSVPSSIEHFRCFHFDLDNNGYSEQIRSFYSSDKKHAIQIFKNDGGIIDQWNFDGMPPINHKKGDRLVTGDYDKDGLSEIYVFCKLGDTIMLNCIEPGDSLSELSFMIL